MLKKLLLVLFFALIVPVSASVAQQFYTDYTMFLDGWGDHVDPNTKAPITGLTESDYPDIDVTSVQQTAEGTVFNAGLISTSANFAGGFSIAFPNGSIRDFGWVIQNGVLFSKGEQANNQVIPGTEQLVNISDNLRFFTLTIPTAEQPAAFGVFVCDFSNIQLLVCDESKPYTYGVVDTYQPIDVPGLEDEVAPTQEVADTEDEDEMATPEVRVEISSTTFRVRDILDCIAFDKPVSLSEQVLDSVVTVYLREDGYGDSLLKPELPSGLREAVTDAKASMRLQLRSFNVNDQPYADILLRLSPDYAGEYIYEGGHVDRNGYIFYSGGFFSSTPGEIRLSESELKFKVVVVGSNAMPTFIDESSSYCEDVM